MRKQLLILVVLLVAATVGHAAENEAFQVLLVNDDGIDAPGLAALVDVLTADPSYRVVVVAPAEQQSGKGSALTLRDDIVLKPCSPRSGVARWSVSATPATAVRVGLEFVLADDPPDLVLSGINRGENVGRIAWYSGTVGAAREAALRGFPAIAFSMQLNWADPNPDFHSAARWAKPIVDAVRENPLPDGVYLNVNMPIDAQHARGYRLCRMGLERPHVSGFEVVSTRGEGVLLKGKWAPARSNELGSDVKALHDGFVAMAPLGLDSTSYAALAELPVLMRLPPPVGEVVGD